MLIQVVPLMVGLAAIVMVFSGTLDTQTALNESMTEDNGYTDTMTEPLTMNDTTTNGVFDTNNLDMGDLLE